MRCDGVVTGVAAIAKHKVVGSTPITRSRKSRHVTIRSPAAGTIRLGLSC
jgi:hypothetical protein